MSSSVSPPASRRVRRTHSRSLSLLVVASTLGVAAGAARAATTAGDPDSPTAPGQRHFGVGATAGTYSGFGAVIGGGGGILKGWFSGGYVPVLLFANSRASDRAVRFNYYTSLQFSEDLALRLIQRPRVEGGLLLGYRYNTVYGHGFGAGFGVIYDLGRRVGLQITGGVAVFPSARERLRARGYPDDRDPPLTPAIQAGANVGIIFFP